MRTRHPGLGCAVCLNIPDPCPDAGHPKALGMLGSQQKLISSASNPAKTFRCVCCRQRLGWQTEGAGAVGDHRHWRRRGRAGVSSHHAGGCAEDTHHERRRWHSRAKCGFAITPTNLPGQAADHLTTSSLVTKPAALPSCCLPSHRLATGALLVGVVHKEGVGGALSRELQLSIYDKSALRTVFSLVVF